MLRTHYLGNGFAGFLNAIADEFPKEHNLTVKYDQKLKKRLYKLYTELVQRFHQEATEGMDAGTFLSKDLPQGVTGFPLPTDSREYININSKRRGGAEVKIRHGNKTRANKKAKHTA